MVVFWDEATGYLKAVCIKRKTPEEVKAAFLKAFGNEIYEIAIFRSDNGGEFRAEFIAYCRSMGTRMLRALPEDPRTNAPEERFHGTCRGPRRRRCSGRAGRCAPSPSLFGIKGSTSTVWPTVQARWHPSRR